MMKNKVDYQQELDQFRTWLGYDFMSLALAESAEYHYVIKWKYATGNLNDCFKGIVLQSGRGIAGIVFKTGKPMIIESVAQHIDTELLFNYPIVRMEKLKSLVAVPLWNDNRVAGVLLGGFRDEQRVTIDMLHQLDELAHRGIGTLNGKELKLS